MSVKLNRAVGAEAGLNPPHLKGMGKGMKDVLGNELREGDLVALQLERPLIWGRVGKIEEGGSLIVGIDKATGAQIKLSRVVVESRHMIEVDPRSPAVALLALRDAEPPPPSQVN